MRDWDNEMEVQMEKMKILNYFMAIAKKYDLGITFVCGDVFTYDRGIPRFAVYIKDYFDSNRRLERGRDFIVSMLKNKVKYNIGRDEVNLKDIEAILKNIKYKITDNTYRKRIIENGISLMINEKFINYKENLNNTYEVDINFDDSNYDSKNSIDKMVSFYLDEARESVSKVSRNSDIEKINLALIEIEKNKF